MSDAAFSIDFDRGTTGGAPPSRHRESTARGRRRCDRVLRARRAPTIGSATPGQEWRSSRVIAGYRRSCGPGQQRASSSRGYKHRPALVESRHLTTARFRGSATCRSRHPVAPTTSGARHLSGLESRDERASKAHCYDLHRAGQHATAMATTSRGHPADAFRTTGDWPDPRAWHQRPRRGRNRIRWGRSTVPRRVVVFGAWGISRDQLSMQSGPYSVRL